ncbi:uncharacterized protein LOC102805409 [Saccoglossus kowalevskii]
MVVHRFESKGAAKARKKQFLPRENVDAAVQSLLASFPVHSGIYGCCGSFVTKVILWGMFGIFLFNVLGGVTVLIGFPVFLDRDDVLLFFVLFVPTILITVALLCCLFTCPRIHRAPERQANLHLIDHGLIVGLARTHKTSCNFGIYFVYFRTSRCLNTLERYLKDKAKGSTTNTGSGSTSPEECILEVDDNHEEQELIEPTTLRDVDEKIKASAREYLVSVCGRYVRMVNENQSYKSPTGFRHSRTGICLCQLVQQNCFHELV